MERTHASHMLPISLRMRQRHTYVTQGLYLNENQIKRVLTGVEGDLRLPTQLLPNSLPGKLAILVSSEGLQEVVSVWCEGSESECGYLSAESKGYIAGHQCQRISLLFFF